MRSSRRMLAVLTVLVAGVWLLFVTPEAAKGRARPQARIATRAVVHGRVTGASQSKPTSFNVFAQRSRPATSVSDSAGGSIVRAPASLSGFDGLADPISRPSDTTGALGDSFFVAAVNTQVAVYDRAGVPVVAPEQLDALHPSSLGHDSFDPKVVYDQYNDTFLLVYLVLEDAPRLSRIVTVAIPNTTADDPSTWCAVSFKGDQVPGAPAVWADYPSVGYNETRVTISTNQFTFPSFQGQFRYSQVMTIDKLGLYDCTEPAPVPRVFAGTKTRDTNGRQAFTIQPAQSVGSSPGAQLLISFEPINGKFDYLVLWRIKPTPTGFALKKACCVSTGRVSFPPAGSQGGGVLNNSDLFWDAGDVRLINAFYDADRNELFAAHTVFKNFTPDILTGGYAEAAVQWYELDPANKLGNSVLARRGVIGSTEVDLGWPTVATDADGTLFITYNRASNPHDEFLSAWVATIPPGSNDDAELLLHAGSATYDRDPGVDRWGDFTAINRDPLDGQNLATFNQYASSTTQWQQFISIVTDN